MTSLPKHHVNAIRPSGPDLHKPDYWVRDRASAGVLKLWGGAPPGPGLTYDAAWKLKETVVGQRKSKTARVELRPANAEALEQWYQAVQTALGGNPLTVEVMSVPMHTAPASPAKRPAGLPASNSWTDESRQAAALAAARAAVPPPVVYDHVRVHEGVMPESVLHAMTPPDQELDALTEQALADVEASLAPPLPGTSDADLAALMEDDDLDSLIDTANAQADSDHSQ